MLSGMESNGNLHETLRAADRAAAAPWVDYPPTPWWHYPCFGLWAAAMVVTYGAFHDHVVVFLPCYLALIALVGVYIVWQRRRRGVSPYGWPPREVRVVCGWYLAGYLVLYGIVVAVMVWSWACAAAVAFAASTAGLVWFEAGYARAVRRVRSRLG